MKLKLPIFSLCIFGITMSLLAFSLVFSENLNAKEDALVKSKTSTQDSVVGESTVREKTRSSTLDNHAVREGIIGLSPKDIYEVQRTKILFELQDDILKWAKGRFWIIAILTLILGFIGVRTIVGTLINESLQDSIKASAKAEAASSIARESTDEARKEVQKYKETVETLQKRATEVDSSFQRLNAIIEASHANLQKGSENIYKDIQLQVEKLENTIGGLLTRFDSEEKVNQFQEMQRELRSQSFLRMEGFAERSQYILQFLFPEKRTEMTLNITQKLESLGFQVAQFGDVKADYVERLYGFPQGTVSKSQNWIVHFSPSSEERAEEIRQILLAEPAINSIVLLPGTEEKSHNIVIILPFIV